jgi:UTP--glucose-1-phosphate uridylyltransferase
LTDGIRRLMESEPVYGFKFEGKRFDAGDKLEFLKATVEFALKRADLGPPFRAYLKGLEGIR